MTDRSLCRVGVFYDGTYFIHAQQYFYHRRGLGWLTFSQFHTLLENFVKEKEQDFTAFKVIYAGWYQGLFPSNQATEDDLRYERKRYQDLVLAGIEPKYEPMSYSQKEKGVDVAMAVDALQMAFQDRIDIVVLVTGDGDFVPLVRALMKQPLRVMAAYFEYEHEAGRSFINQRLLAACNYTLNITALEKDRKYQAAFQELFRPTESPTGLEPTELR